MKWTLHIPVLGMKSWLYKYSRFGNEVDSIPELGINSTLYIPVLGMKSTLYIPVLGMKSTLYIYSRTGSKVSTLNDTFKLEIKFRA